jgi:PhzF family phenazine biosynthesis protein
MDVLRLAAFSHNGKGGNPAGVAFCDEMPAEDEMSRIAREVGYSETAFLVARADGWRVRYFAPAMEVPFCGHATIALGAALGEHFGAGDYRLFLNQGEIHVRAEKATDGWSSTLTSAGTSSEEAPREYVAQVLAAFHLNRGDLDPAYPVRFASAGAKHLLLILKEREKLAGMKYPFDMVRELMQDQGLITISLLWPESEDVFHSRNAFASGGVYEDPATGAAAAALAGYLRDINWQGKDEFTILQGEEMGMPSCLRVKYGPEPGAGVQVGGETRPISF